MTALLPTRSSGAGSVRGPARLQARLAEAEATLRAIRSGEVDAVVVAGEHGPRVFTLEGAEHAYRMLIESMNEGALTLTADAVILYSNACFARMVRLPLEQVIGCSFDRFLSAAGQAEARPFLRRAAKSGSRIQALLRCGDGSDLAVLLSVRRLTSPGVAGATLGMVVTDMTEARRSEERLRALSQRLVETQETERREVAVDLHENISQLTYATLLRCDNLVRTLPARAGSSRAEVLKLRQLLEQATDGVRRIAHELRPSALDDLGLLPVVRMACKRFGERANVRVNLEGVRRMHRLPEAVETALYRILQEVLRNIEQHASARCVTVCLRQQDQQALLAIIDDGVGFNPARRLGRRSGKSRLGLLGVRERAASLGGAVEVQSAAGRGTTVQVRIPFKPGIPEPPSL